jgi:PST family polysaccharide transporter
MPTEGSPVRTADEQHGGEDRANWGSSLRQGLVWSAAAFVASKALALAAIVVLARLLAPSEFGLLAAVVAYIAVIELGSDLGMKATIIYEQERGVSSRIQTAFTLNLALAAALSMVGVALAPLVAGFFGVAGHTDLFRLGALNLLLTGLGNTHDALLLRDMSFILRIRPQVVRDLVRGVVAIALAVAGFGAAALVIGHLAGTAAWCAVQWIMSPLRPRLQFDRAIARSMIGYGRASAMLEVLAALTSRIDVLVIGGLLGSLALGVYTIAFRLPDMLIASVAYTATVVAFPALARKRDEDRGSLAGATLQLLRYQALYALPLGAAVATLSVPLINVLFSPTWQAAAPVMVPIAIAAAVRASVFPLGDTLKAAGRQGTLVRINLLAIPALIGGCVLAQDDGITAVAWAIAIVIAIVGSLQTGAVRQLLGLSWQQLGAALLPALTTALGVLAGSGAVRLLWDSLDVTALLAGAVAGAAGGFVALRWLATATYVDLTRQLRGVGPRRRIRAVAGS